MHGGNGAYARAADVCGVSMPGWVRACLFVYFGLSVCRKVSAVECMRRGCLLKHTPPCYPRYPILPAARGQVPLITPSACVCLATTKACTQ